MRSCFFVWRSVAALLVAWGCLTTTAKLRAAEPEVPTLPLSPQLQARCLEILRGGLKSDEFWPAMHAAEALTQADHAGEVRAVLAPLLAKDSDPLHQCGLSRELVRAGDREKSARLLELLASTNLDVQIHAAESLYKVGEIGDGVLLKKLVAESKSGSCRMMAAAALARRGDRAAKTFIQEQLKDDSDDQRQLAVWCLARLGTDVTELRAMAEREKKPLLQTYALCAAAMLGDAKSAQALAQKINDPDPSMRTFIAEAAGVARAVDLAGKLETLLSDPVLDVRIRAAQALLAMSKPSA